MFIGMWNFCDDGGVHPDSTKRLKMQVFPADNFSGEDIAGFVNELVAAGLLRRFEADGKPYLSVTGWHHQKIERPTYKHPRPLSNEGSAAARGARDEESPSTAQAPDGPSPNGERELDELSANARRTLPPGRDADADVYGAGNVDEAKPSKGPGRMRKPSVEEVRDYCREHGYTIDACHFVDHYMANGWIVGKAPMKDWKACVRNWERNEHRRTGPKTASDDPHGNQQSRNKFLASIPND
ncbi:hypothetical protein [Lacipirellula limnantheis]|uniref:hypothetical protein n=1 Tax=Lacipirellula limnantheis TaxID=2528024 RepID=UPI0011A2DB3F|nr:hypothetical protein [Lacipirellula limnantheis]